jgi:hypothetical protein
MSARRGGTDGGSVPQRGAPLQRLVRAWRNLPEERRLAAFAALGLFVTLFLPWYQETVIASGGTALRSASASLTGWGAFSFVEAAILLVAGGVLVLLFMRAEGQAFHVPGGDGGVVTAAGVWACVLILWRIFDKQGTTVHGQYTTTSGIEWGIFIALGVALLLTYAGSRIRIAHEPEPPLPGERRTPRRAGGRIAAVMGRGRSRTAEPSRTRRPSRTPDMEADETWVEDAPTAPTRRMRDGGTGAGDEPPEAAARQLRDEPRRAGDGPPEAATRQLRDEPRGGGDGARRSRPLDPREIEDLDIAEPPTERFARSTASSRNRGQSDDPARPARPADEPERPD